MEAAGGLSGPLAHFLHTSDCSGPFSAALHFGTAIQGISASHQKYYFFKNTGCQIGILSNKIIKMQVGFYGRKTGPEFWVKRPMVGGVWGSLSLRPTYEWLS